MHPLTLSDVSSADLAALDHLYRSTRDARMRTRVQIILLAAEQHLLAPQIATIVRKDEQTVRRWLKRYQAEGINGLVDAPRPGASAKVTPAYRERLLYLVRQRPRSLNRPFSLWTNQRLADVLAEETGIRVSDETVRRELARADIVLSRPQHTITSPDPEYPVKKRRLKRPVTTEPTALYFTTPTNST
jgi:transposase